MTSLPFNNKTLSSFIDIAIFFENSKYTVTGLTDNFEGVNLGSFDFVLDAYARCCEYGFEVREYFVPISPYENKTIPIMLDQEVDPYVYLH